MPLSKERMREYMKEYRLKNLDYAEKHKQQSIENYKNKYNTNPEFREKRKEYEKNYYSNKKSINNIEIIA